MWIVTTASSGAVSTSRARPAGASSSIAQRQGASGGGSTAIGSSPVERTWRRANQMVVEATAVCV
jgi:hypothetical protein